MRIAPGGRGGSAGALILLGLLAAGSVGACGGGGSGTTLDPADSAFVSTVQSQAPDINQYRSNTALIRLGHAACDDFAAGVSYQQTADRLAIEQGSDTLPSEDLGAVISAAVTNLCPKYESSL